ncbi:MAG: radical SAM family heme chaperone HemW, partial [Candidatus Zixiibacteriota bacterium]
MPFSLYLHYPFCKKKCSYCDYYKEAYQGNLEKEFYRALNIETELTAEKIEGNDFEIVAIFIGGGTPSISNLKYLIEWLENLRRFFKLTDSIEFSIETNPESITPDNLQVIKDLGINRPIFGIQSFNKKLLQTLSRQHNPHHSYQAIYFANALGFNNFGVDFIFGLPGQTSRMLSDDLDQIIDLNPPHISYYQLTVEESTYLNKLVSSGQLKLPGQELLLAMYRGIYKQLTDAGYTRYEISSFAKPGYE